MPTVNNTRVLRSANRYIVLMALLERGQLTVEDIIRITQLSRPTVLQILKELMQEQLIAKAGKHQTEVGRQPTLYTINNQSYFAMGIDIDLPEVHLAISNLLGNLVYSCSQEISFDIKAPVLANALVDLINRALAEVAIDKSSIIGLGLGIPAIVDTKRNMAPRISQVPTWADLDIAGYIFENTGIHVFVHNDVHLLGLIERKQKNLQAESFIYIAHRSGVGSAVFIDGKLYDGSYGNSGTLGHTCVDYNGPRCECGNRGCLEMYCSRRAIVQQYNELAEKKGLSPCTQCNQVFVRSCLDDPVAREVLGKSGRILGIGVSNLIKAFDIYHIILDCNQNAKNTPFYSSFTQGVNDGLSGFAFCPVTIELGSAAATNSGLAGSYYVLSNFFHEPALRVHT
ncbi:ROK family transcriptional regulator [Diplocloster agilis]|uniref:ROK family transcriptional regulator n=1 Tax=Diplocloster agilis TaxID=2850323 RepID=UPI00082344C2|nr:ROK family transcriptional regulator [Suonthocola fibrivorans]MCU6732334.1 ROK family transcriptional regulator [Suonthocola fibrivorans]SCI43725.1 Making large colonies protein [uncultured Clostridium sp.]